MEHGYITDKVLERAFKYFKKWGARDRKLVAETLFDVVRWWRKILWSMRAEGVGEPDWLAMTFVMWLHTVSRREGLSAKEMLFAISERWPQFEIPHTTILEAVERFSQKSDSWAVDESIPDWMAEWLEKEISPHKAQALVHMSNAVAPVFVRANLLKVATAEELVRKLAAESIEAEVVVNDAVRIAERRNLFKSRAFAEGLFEVQDIHSQKIAPFLGAQPGERVVDACAGGGGKTLHLAALMKNKGKIVAMDVYERKLEDLRKRAARAGVSCVDPRVIDSTKVIKRLHESFDRVLLDVPCSGLGVLRRNPDAKWRLSAEEMQRLSALQSDILMRYSKMAKPGGTLVYSTCSILPSENEKQVREFLKATPEWRLEDMKTLWPEREGGDGFFMARMIRGAL